MNNWIIIALLSGSVILVGILTLFFSAFFQRIKQYVTTIGVSFVLSLICLHILPELFSSGGSNLGLYLLVGFLIQIVLELFSRGIEHGHIHGEHGHSHEGHNHDVSKNILFSLFFGLCVHAFIEGIPLFILEDIGGHDHAHHGHAHEHVKADFSLVFFWAVLSHKIPVAIVLMLFFISAKIKKGLALFLFIAFAFMTPLGGLLGASLQEKEWFGALSVNLLAITTGMLLHITTLLIFEEYHEKKDKTKNLLLIVSGLVLGFILFN